ncbi:zinc-binding dehydrogenase [Halorubrum sp. CBA1125]|uniref:zinc-dependent alcohol dehydrogenase n=1 Tax=Halorubrum sp. CBA1125 TaxID=2668072 RepID=UPI0012E7E51F|nr:zinc-binding dehydrogenase [Halorubrum sp. CBA1125]MUW13969.1 zinc-binding dehydrogenase [Halorubrum sp. CBA1125]
MKANALVMEEPGELSQKEIDIPEIGDDEVLLRVELSGICGSDVHMNEGGMDLDFPVVPGHEFAGVIEEVGDDVRTDSKGEEITEGDAATVVPGIVCGDCWYCDNVPARPTTCENRDVYGYFNVDEPPYGHGGFSEYVVIEDRASFYKLPDDMDVELGALAEPLSVATHALEQAYKPGMPHAREGFGPGKSIAVQGVGPVGLLTVAAANNAGAGNIIVIDAVEKRLEFARKFGADNLVDLTEHDGDEALNEHVSSLTNGNVGPDVVVESAGYPPAVRQGIEILRDGGTLVEVGHFAYNGEVEINPTRLVQKYVDIRGSLVYPPSQFETSIELLDQLDGEVPFRDLFNYKVGFEGAEEAYEKQANGEAYRATIHPGGI